jgi:hypothetical protein
MSRRRPDTPDSRLVPTRTWRVWRVPVAVVLALAPLVGWAPVARAAIILNDVVVRVYDNTGLPDAVRRTSLTRAAEIFARAEVEIGWVHCPARCGRAPSPDQLILRVTRSPATAIGLGSSLIDPVLQAGRLATVYVDQVDAMARRSNTDRVAILSRAIAHEIGHLLLGTTEHTRSGLMRGIWTAEELRRNQGEDWQFSPFQRTLIRARIAAGTPARSNAGAPKAPAGRVGG